VTRQNKTDNPDQQQRKGKRRITMMLRLSYRRPYMSLFSAAFLLALGTLSSRFDLSDGLKAVYFEENLMPQYHDATADLDCTEAMEELSLIVVEGILNKITTYDSSKVNCVKAGWHSWCPQTSCVGDGNFDDCMQICTICYFDEEGDGENEEVGTFDSPTDVMTIEQVKNTQCRIIDSIRSHLTAGPVSARETDLDDPATCLGMKYKFMTDFAISVQPGSSVTAELLKANYVQAKTDMVDYASEVSSIVDSSALTGCGEDDTGEDEVDYSND